MDASPGAGERMKIQPFNEHAAEYDEWFIKNPFVFKSELHAIRTFMPKGKDRRGMEIGMGTGRFARALGIEEGIEPAEEMRKLAGKRGLHPLDAVAEDLPYRTGIFDVVLMNFCICYLDDVQQSFFEAWRVLKKNGVLIVGFIDRNSRLGKIYARRRAHSLFYRDARFYSVPNVQKKLRKAGFRELDTLQTLFRPLQEMDSIEEALPGHGKGSYVVISAKK
jgi:SAM-dependent methyltransferase